MSEAEQPPQRKRKPKRDTSLPSQCPICGDLVLQKDFDAHLKLELSRIDDEVTSSANNSNSGRRSRQSSRTARKKLQKALNVRPKIADPAYQRDLKAVKSIAKKRRERQQQGTNNLEGWSDPANSSCFMCGTSLFGSIEEINEHIDACLKAQANGETATIDDEEEGMETYTIGGEERIRVCSLLEDYGDAMNAVSTKGQEDVDEELVIDDDGPLLFGSSQFGDGDLVRIESGGEEENVNMDSDDDEEVNITDDAEEVSASSTMLDALKAKIRSQNKMLENIPKCLICLEYYKSPLVSTICWHVHCEKCWLETLGAKRLCPQCQVITSPSDLRRVFL